MKKAKYTAETVADWFIWYNRLTAELTQGDLMTNSRLEKLLYYAQGASLPLNDRPLFNEDFVKGEYGVILPDIHMKYKTSWVKGIDIKKDCPEEISKEDSELFVMIYDIFGKYSAHGLSLLNREEYTWKTAEENAIIPKENIRTSFERKYLLKLMNPVKATDAEKHDWAQLHQFVV